MRRFQGMLWAGVLVLAGGCGGDGFGPGGSGSISLRLVAPSASRVAADGIAASSTGGASSQALDNLRVTLAGPTNRTATFSCAATCEGTIDGLSAGSYAITVEGLVGTEVDYFGQTSGVNVVAGDTTAATISWTSFQPVLAAFAADTVEVLRFPVTFSAVASATGYVLQYAQTPSFSGANSVNLTTTSTEIVVTDEAQYYVRVRATNDVVTNAGRWSASASLVALQGVATVTVTPATPTIAAGATQQFTAEARDGDNNVVSNVQFFWASSNHNVATVSQTGLATGVGGGSVTITAVGKGTPGGAALTVSPRTPSQLAFSVQPSAAAVTNNAISPAIQVEIRDAAGARVTTARDLVTLAIDQNPPGNGRLFGTLEVNAVNGIATFSGVSINMAGEDYTLTATSGALTAATSTAFTVTSPIIMYKDTDGWFNGEELGLRNAPFFFRRGIDYWVRPMADLAQGIPAGARVVIFPSVASGGAAGEGQATTQASPASQTAIDTFVRAGGWVLGHMANNTTAGYTFPGLTGTADDTNSCTGLTLTTFNHPLVRGPNELVGGGDDLDNANIDVGLTGWCSENHGSLLGILPAGATILMTEQAGSVRPVYATYALGAGTIVVTTLTIEGPVGLSTPTVSTMRNHYYWALRGAGAPTKSPAPAVTADATAGLQVERWVSSERRQ